MDKIYTITTLKLHYIRYKLRSGKWYRPLTIKDSRIVGWYPNLTMAHNAVAGNNGDMNENGSYPWVVIEKTWNGLYPHTEEYWYKWIKGKYRKAKKPQQFNHMCNFGIG